MSQILHIFRKDIRQFWKEILVTLVILSLYVWREPRNWFPDWRHHSFLSSFISFSVVLALCWMFFVARAVQGEPLVGDRQFWITRPYRWVKLLAAKIFLIVVVLYVPVLITGAYLLKKAGFSPAAELPRFMGSNITVLVIVLIALLASGAITRNVVQWVLALIGAIAYVSAVAFLEGKLPTDIVDGSPGELLQEAVIIAGLVSIILLQYARRRTRASLVIAAAVAVLIPAIMVATPVRWIANRAYPASTSSPGLPVLAAFDPSLEWKRQSDAVVDDDSKRVFRVPLLISGVATGTVVSVDGVLAEVRTNDGIQWSSGWSRGGATFYPETRQFLKEFEMKRKDWDRLSSKNATLHIWLALSEYRMRDSTVITVPDGEFTMPGLGRCRLNPTGDVTCLYAVKTPTGLIASIHSDQVTCKYSGSENAPESGLASYDSLQAETGPFSPVDTVTVSFNAWEGARYRGGTRICAGMPIALANTEFVRRERVVFDTPHIVLRDYQQAIEGVFSIRR